MNPPAPPVILTLKKGDTDKGIDTDGAMDTEELDELQPGATPLAITFCKSATPKAMLDLIEGAYNQELLSTRLQGNAVKEALAITLLLQFRKTTPLDQTPAWMPPALLDHSEDVLQARHSCQPWQASQLSRKKRAMQGITFGILKRKLPAAKGESSNSQRPAKKQRLFTTIPEKMVKIFAQYM